MTPTMMATAHLVVEVLETIHLFYRSGTPVDQHLHLARHLMMMIRTEAQEAVAMEAATTIHPILLDRDLRRILILTARKARLMFTKP